VHVGASFDRAADALLAARRTGARTHVEAARAAGVHRVTLQKWLARGAAGEEPYAQFRQAYFAAYAEHVTKRLARFPKASSAA
jgi:hypothetical protein